MSIHDILHNEELLGNEFTALFEVISHKKNIIGQQNQQSFKIEGKII